MKISWFCTLIAICLFLIACNEQKYSITGTFPIEGFDGRYIYLSKKDSLLNNYVFVDSVLIEGKDYTFTGNIVKPEMGYIFINTMGNVPLQTGFASLILEKGDISIQFDEDNIPIISGTKGNETLTKLRLEQQTCRQKDMEFYEAVTPIVEAYQIPLQLILSDSTKITKELKDMMRDLKGMNDDLSDKVFNFISLYIKTPAGINLIDDFRMLTPQQIEALDSLSGYQIKAKLEKKLEEFMGQRAMNDMFPAGSLYADVMGANQHGDSIAVADYVTKNKYVLLEFWNSGCAPCIEEIPVLAKAYDMYHDKGLEIISIYDGKETFWKNIIEVKKMNWVQMKSSSAFRTYKINAIPHSMLIDANGKIVDKDLRGDMLLSKLETLLGK